MTTGGNVTGEPPPADALLRRVARSLDALAGLRAGEGLLVAVSGGPDSTALLRLLLEASGTLLPPLRIAAAHFHHGLRGKPADGDLEFARSLAASLGLPFHEGRGDVPARARREGRGFEAAARRARYEFLLDAALRAGARAVATGHTADDQAETVLLRLRRGCGLPALAAIRPARPLDPQGRVLLVRPLLEVRRDELLAWLDARGIAFRTDETNFDPSFERNRIRLETLPALRRDFPGADAALARIASAALALLEAAGEGRHAGGGAPDPGPPRGVFLGRAASPSPLFAGRAFQDAFARAGGPPGRLLRSHILAMTALLAGSGPRVLALPRGLRARRVPGGLVLETRPAAPGPPPAAGGPLPVPGSARAGPWTLSARIQERGRDEDEKRGGGEGGRGRRIERVDADVLALPLEVRFRRPGDRFHPLGAPGRQRLKEFLRAEGVPEEERDAVPLVADASGRILWVAGLRIAHWARVTPGTRRVLRLGIEETE